eukprot:6361758-Pyramimonas_sp.AAC.2
MKKKVVPSGSRPVATFTTLFIAVKFVAYGVSEASHLPSVEKRSIYAYLTKCIVELLFCTSLLAVVGAG